MIKAIELRGDGTLICGIPTSNTLISSLLRQILIELLQCGCIRDVTDGLRGSS